METRILTANDWLELALEVLMAQGHTALKAQPLSKKLNVTRGSFYHHFDSLEEFHRHVIAHWSNRTSGQVSLRAKGIGEPLEALTFLLQTTLRSGGDLERAVRSWSTMAPIVAEAVDKVDRERIDIAETLLRDAGVPADVAEVRAKLLYWAAIGRLMLPHPQNNVLSDAEISDVVTLFAQT